MFLGFIKFEVKFCVKNIKFYVSMSGRFDDISKKYRLIKGESKFRLKKHNLFVLVSKQTLFSFIKSTTKQRIKL